MLAALIAPAAFALYGAGAFWVAYQRDAPVRAAYDSAPTCAPARGTPDCRESAQATIVDYRSASGRGFTGGDPAALRMADGATRDVLVAGVRGPMRMGRGVAVDVESYRGHVVSFTDGQGTAFTSENPDRLVQNDVLGLVLVAAVGVLFGGLTILVLLGPRGRRRRRIC